MPNKINSTNYAGRTVDLLLLKTIDHAPAVNKRVTVDVSNVQDVPMIVSGIEKLAQRFINTFLNTIGSTKFQPDHGTELVSSVRAGKIYDAATLQAVAAEANSSTCAQIQEEDEAMSLAGDTTPEDETLEDSEILDLQFSREESKVKISIRLTSAAGMSYVYIIPVAIGVS